MSETGFRPLFRNCLVPGKEPGLHSSLADVGAHLSSRENAGLQIASGCSCSTSSALALAAVRHASVPGIFQLREKGLDGIAPHGHHVHVSAGGNVTATEDGGAKRRFAKVAPVLPDVVLTKSERLGPKVFSQMSSLSLLLHSSKQSLPTSAG